MGKCPHILLQEDVRKNERVKTLSFIIAYLNQYSIGINLKYSTFAGAKYL